MWVVESVSKELSRATFHVERVDTSRALGQHDRSIVEQCTRYTSAASSFSEAFDPHVCFRRWLANDTVISAVPRATESLNREPDFVEGQGQSARHPQYLARCDKAYVETSAYSGSLNASTFNAFVT